MQGSQHLLVWRMKFSSTSHLEIPTTERDINDTVKNDVAKWETINPLPNNVFDVVDVIRVHKFKITTTTTTRNTIRKALCGKQL